MKWKANWCHYFNVFYLRVVKSPHVSGPLAHSQEIHTAVDTTQYPWRFDDTQINYVEIVTSVGFSFHMLLCCLQVSAREGHKPCARYNCIRNVSFLICVLLFLVVSPTNISTWLEVCVCWQPCEVHWPVQWSLISNRSGYKIIVLNLSVADDMTVLREGTTASYWQTGK
jgi:hypothetical protein